MSTYSDSLTAIRSAPAAAPAPRSDSESDRLQALFDYRILDTEAEQSYDDLTSLAAMICGTPVALINFIDGERQWFKSRIGIEAQSMSLDVGFCTRAILEPGEVMVINDARADARFADNAVVRGDAKVRFYAGAPLVTPHGQAIGTLCVIDQQARPLDEQKQAALKALSRQVVAQLELRRSLALAEERSLHDTLTGAANRRAFDQRLQLEWNRLTRGQRPLSLLMIDVDHFKDFNDRFGHPAGDEVLRQVVALATPLVRKPDLLARYGGEEFSVVLPEAGADAAAVVAERIRRGIESGPWSQRPVTVSIGVATVMPQSGADASGLVALADEALYEAKRAGRNRFKQADPG